MNINRKKGIKALENIIFPLLLALYPLRNIAIGVDLSDTTYNLANYMFLENKSGMQLFSTYLANVFGRFFMNLPGGNTMMFMNLYTALIVSVLALLGYYFYRKILPSWLVFLGEFLAISLCWCPTVILYNYLTYLFFTLAVIFLYQALIKEKAVYFLIAGVMLGFNVFVRFPNVLETALILSVWYYAFLHKKKFAKVMTETGLCLAGFLLGIGSMLILISIRYGISEYVVMLEELFVLGTGEVGYSPMEMIATILQAYRDAFKWLIYLVIYTITGVIIYSVKPEKAVKIKTTAYVLGGVLLVIWLGKRGMFSTNYRGDYLAMFQWVAILLLFAIAYFVWGLVRKDNTKEEKLLASLLLVIILITPLGSNNYIYSNINNLFLVTPVIITAFVKFFFQKGSNKALPIRISLALILVVTFVQSTLFGVFFVFRGGETNQKWDSKIEQNDVLKGMYTSKERKEAIEKLTKYCEEENLIGKQVILYDYVPGLSYALQMPCAISTTYPEMDSYSVDTFAKELTNVYKMSKIEKSERPVLIVSTNTATMLVGESDQPKIELLIELVRQENYQQVFSNTLFTVYR